MFSEEAKRSQRSRTKADKTDIESRHLGSISWPISHFTPRVVTVIFFLLVDICCPRGWVQHEKRCFYISNIPRSLEESRKYCTSLSSKLAAFSELDDDFSVVSMALSIF